MPRPFPNQCWRETRVRSNPKLLRSALQWAKPKQLAHAAIARDGFDLQDGMPHLLDARFGDDISLFAETRRAMPPLLNNGAKQKMKRYRLN